MNISNCSSPWIILYPGLSPSVGSRRMPDDPFNMERILLPEGKRYRTYPEPSNSGVFPEEKNEEEKARSR